MALVGVRSTFAKTAAVKSLLGAPVNPACAAAPIQVAGLKATYGGTYPYKNPYPYKEKSFGMFHQFFDNATRRMCDNSKIITVDGNVAVGKNEFAQRLAKEFDLQFIPAVPDSAVFKVPGNNFDIRELNQFVADKSMHMYDWEMFLKEENLTRGFVGRLQLQWYGKKLETYSMALKHLFHTGQGAVIVGSAYSDHVMAEAMRKCGYVTANYMDYYEMFVRNSLCELLKPHVSIFLDTPLELVKERLKKRGNATELASPVMSDKFLQSIDDIYKNKFIPKMSESGEVMEIDWTDVADDLDMDAIAVELEMLRLDATDANDPRFQDWYDLSEDKLSFYRRRFGSDQFMIDYTTRPLPLHCPEIMYNPEDYQQMNAVFNNHPAIKYAVGAAPELGHSRLW